jgi:hypothetical protein
MEQLESETPPAGAVGSLAELVAQSAEVAAGAFETAGPAYLANTAAARG